MNLALSIMTAGFTAFCGTIVLVVSQTVQRLFIEPIQEHRKAVGEIVSHLELIGPMWEAESSLAKAKQSGHDLLYFMEPREAAKALRSTAAKLHMSVQVIPAYDLVAQLGLVKDRKKVADLAENLAGWSNSIAAGDNRGFQCKIRALLSL